METFRYSVDPVRSQPRVRTGAGLHYLNNATPTNTPSGDINKSVLVVSNDSVFSECCEIYGMAHDVGAPLTNGTDFGAMVRANVTASVSDFRLFGADLEIDVAEVTYGPWDGSNVVGTQANTALLSSRGDFVGIISYESATTTVTADFNGQYTYASAYPTTVTDGAQMRLGAGGDASPTEGIGYQGLIYGKLLSPTERSTLETNAQTFYGITAAPSCSGTPPATVLSVLGITNVDSAWGLRAVDTHRVGPVVILKRASDSTFQSFGLSGCDLDVASVTTFCSMTTCSVYQLYNQARSVQGHLTAFNTDLLDINTLVNASNQPVYTPSCLGSLSCLTFGATDILQDPVTNPGRAFNQPYTMFAVVKNTTIGTFGGVLVSNGMFHRIWPRRSAEYCPLPS